jgi:hypothetical protein
MLYRLALAIAAIVMLATVLPAQPADSVQAVLLHKSEEAFLHAVPLQPGYLISFTVPSTGVMKPLLKTEPKSAEDAKAVLAGAGAPGGGRFRRGPLPADLVAGVAVDAQRLYVLTATRVFQQAADGDGGAGDARGRAGRSGRSARARAAADKPVEMKLIGHQFKLHAFSLKDGTALMGDGYELPLVNEDPKATEPPDTTKVTETLGRGLLEVVSGGVKSRGTAITFTGNDVKSVDTQGKQFTPPPGFFVRQPFERIG